VCVRERNRLRERERENLDEYFTVLSLSMRRRGRRRKYFFSETFHSDIGDLIENVCWETEKKTFFVISFEKKTEFKKQLLNSFGESVFTLTLKWLRYN
jgi:hypothetical protein